MNLNLRLSISVLAPGLLVLVVGTALIIANARQAVAQEIEASASLMLQLLTAVTVSGGAADRRELHAALAERLGTLADVRHLNIALLSAERSIVLPAAPVESAPEGRVPGWFSRLVAPPPVEYRRRLSGPGLPYAEIAIQADPRDEIAEAWDESRIALGLLVAFALLAAGLIFVIVRRAFEPLERILDALSVIQRGKYAVRLPRYELPEMRRLADGFNRMAEVLEAQQRENRELSKRSLAIQESERRYLARELHDELGQSVSAIKAIAVSIARQPEATGASLRSSAESIVSICNRVYDAVRGLMNRLRPAVVDELGLRLGLERSVDDWNAHHAETFCRLSIIGEIDGLGDEIQIGVYRIVQECLTNVAKHAAASTVDVSLQVSAEAGERRLALRVRDDGRGFEAGRHTRGIGLAGIRERAESLGGEMIVVSEPDGGAEVRISVPVRGSEEEIQA